MAPCRAPDPSQLCTLGHEISPLLASVSPSVGKGQRSLPDLPIDEIDDGKDLRQGQGQTAWVQTPGLPARLGASVKTETSFPFVKERRQHHLLGR